jgi:hypothetical protein
MIWPLCSAVLIRCLFKHLYPTQVSSELLPFMSSEDVGGGNLVEGKYNLDIGYLTPPKYSQISTSWGGWLKIVGVSLSLSTQTNTSVGMQPFHGLDMSWIFSWRRLCSSSWDNWMWSIGLGTLWDLLGDVKDEGVLWVSNDDMIVVGMWICGCTCGCCAFIVQVWRVGFGWGIKCVHWEGLDLYLLDAKIQTRRRTEDPGLLIGKTFLVVKRGSHVEQL